jgi:radical SAM protein with 4Fe4S-binding SPASM domain
MPDLEGMKIVNDLYTTARNMNFRTEDPEKPSPQGACSAQRGSYFTIDPYLRLFKCAILPPFEKNSVGTVDVKDARPVYNYVNVDFLSRDPMVIEPCSTCKLVPMCRGGCPVEIYETKGTTHSYVCRKPAFYETVKENLTNYVKKNM